MLIIGCKNCDYQLGRDGVVYGVIVYNPKLNLSSVSNIFKKIIFTYFNGEFLL